VRSPGPPARPVLHVWNRHGGNGVVSQFRCGPDARRLRQCSEAFHALAHLAAVATSLRLTLKRNEELLARPLLTSARGFQRGTSFSQRIVLLVSFLSDARIARREGEHRQEQGDENSCRRDQSTAVSLRQLLQEI